VTPRRGAIAVLILAGALGCGVRQTYYQNEPARGWCVVTRVSGYFWEPIAINHTCRDASGHYTQKLGTMSASIPGLSGLASEVGPTMPITPTP